jgi:hypothetical protein
VLIERPWARVTSPTEIPDPVADETLAALDDAGFAALLRDQLVPRQPHGPERDRWERLWTVLVETDALAERAFDVLEEFLDTIERAKAGGVEDRERKRVEKYERFVNAAWNRLETVERPLGWAGRGAMVFNAPARKVIDELVLAIAAHRRGVQSTRPTGDVDEELWRVLRRVRLDPDRPPRSRS